MNMNLYQLKNSIERCLKILPKEPLEVVTRCDDGFPVKDICLDAKCLTITVVSDKYIHTVPTGTDFLIETI